MKFTAPVAALLLLTPVATPATAQPGATPPLALVCEGRGDVKRMTKNYARRPNSNAPGYVPDYQPVAGLVRVDLAEGAGRARLLAALNPVGGGDWQKIRKLEFGPDRIRGQLSTGIITTARLEIDRSTGAFSIHGEMGQFSGRCAAADQRQRAF